MYRSFELRNFRCFRELTITDLERVNLIAGVNNIGKTALLEALFLHCGAYNPALTLRLNAFRGIESAKIELRGLAEMPWDSIFSGFDVSQHVELAGENDQAGHRGLRLKVVRQTQELAIISPLVQHDPERTSAPTSLETPHVLELDYEDGRGQRGRYYMVLDQKGAHAEPVPPPPPLPAFFLAARARIPLTEDAERFGKMEIIGQQDVLSEALQVIEPRLRRLAVVVTGGVPMVHGDVGLGRLVPLPLMGEGMARLASLVLAIGNAQGGVVLVDEIENGLHHSILPKVWQAIDKVSRQFSTQVFATTHSLECITAAHQAFSQSERYAFRLHRLERVQEMIHAITYDQEALAAAIDTGLEVR